MNDSLGRSPDETRRAEVLLGGAMRPLGPAGSCPTDEELAAFIEGRGSDSERTALTAHIERCETCYGVIAATADLVDEFSNVVIRPLPEPAPRRGLGPWLRTHRVTAISALGAAAAVVLAVMLTRTFHQRSDPLETALARLDHSLGEFRPTEARLTDSTHRPPAPPTRAAMPGAEASLDVRDAATAVERDALTALPEARAQAMAKVYLARREPDRAVEAIAPFVSRSDSARFLSDASAAYLARRRDGDLAQALDLAQRAVARDPRLAEAWFNLGLAYDALGRYAEAAKAWEQVIKLEPDSEWAREAAERRAKRSVPREPSSSPQSPSSLRTILGGDRG